MVEWKRVLRSCWSYLFMKCTKITKAVKSNNENLGSQAPYKPSKFKFRDKIHKFVINSNEKWMNKQNVNRNVVKKDIFWILFYFTSFLNFKRLSNTSCHVILRAEASFCALFYGLKIAFCARTVVLHWLKGCFLVLS